MTMSIKLLPLVCLVSLAQAQSGTRLWVLQAPSNIVEYDPSTFAVRSLHEVPRGAFESPKDLRINSRGQMLFIATSVREPDGLVHTSSSPRIWFWDGSSARYLNRTITNAHAPRGGNVLVSSGNGGWRSPVLV